MSQPLTADDLARMEHRSRRFSGAYTGTSGTLAADVMRLLEERRRLLCELARHDERRPPCAGYLARSLKRLTDLAMNSGGSQCGSVCPSGFEFPFADRSRICWSMV